MEKVPPSERLSKEIEESLTGLAEELWKEYEKLCKRDRSGFDAVYSFIGDLPPMFVPPLMTVLQAQVE